MSTSIDTGEAEVADRPWRFRSRGFERVSVLWLYPELDCWACIDDADVQSGVAQLAYYESYVQRRYPEMWEADAVRIDWFVEGDGGVFEFAPTTPARNFLTFFSHPVDAETGEPLNWWKLPVRITRFPAAAKALGWVPSPFQTVAPLRSILTNSAPTAPRQPPPPARG